MWPDAKASFATKYVDRDLLDLDSRGRTRMTFSLMPEADSRLLDLRSTPIRQRIDVVGVHRLAAVDATPIADSRTALATRTRRFQPRQVSKTWSTVGRIRALASERGTPVMRRWS